MARKTRTSMKMNEETLRVQTMKELGQYTRLWPEHEDIDIYAPDANVVFELKSHEKIIRADFEQAVGYAKKKGADRVIVRTPSEMRTWTDDGAGFDYDRGLNVSVKVAGTLLLKPGAKRPLIDKAFAQIVQSCDNRRKVIHTLVSACRTETPTWAGNVYSDPSGFAFKHTKEDAGRLKAAEREFALTKHAFENLKGWIIHNYCTLLNVGDRGDNGKFYTPPQVTVRTREMLEAVLSADGASLLDFRVTDFASGCGAFVDVFEDCNLYACDIDADAADLVKLIFPAVSVDCVNSLFMPGRGNFPGLNSAKRVIYVGNPPWSGAGNSMSDTKDGAAAQVHEELKSADLAISFLKQAKACGVEYCAVVLPFALLMKARRYDLWAGDWRIRKVEVFSSKHFEGTHAMRWPCCIVVLRNAKGVAWETFANRTLTTFDGTRFKVSEFEGRTCFDVRGNCGTKSPIGLYVFDCARALKNISDFRYAFAARGSADHQAVTLSSLTTKARTHSVAACWKSVVVTEDRTMLWNKANVPRLDGPDALHVLHLLASNPRGVFDNPTGIQRTSVASWLRSAAASDPSCPWGKLAMEYLKTGDTDKVLSETRAAIVEEIRKVK